jgi:hypothetical protein
LDNCPNDYNQDQADADSDSSGDVCDTDDDNDGVADVDDNCPLDANPSQSDADVDGAGDACDPIFNDDTVVTYVQELTLEGTRIIVGLPNLSGSNATLGLALQTLAAFDNQLEAKAGHPKNPIPEAEADELRALSAEIRATIELLIETL